MGTDETGSEVVHFSESRSFFPHLIELLNALPTLKFNSPQPKPFNSFIPFAPVFSKNNVDTKNKEPVVVSFFIMVMRLEGLHIGNCPNTTFEKVGIWGSSMDLVGIKVI